MADFLCTMTLLNLKLDQKILSRSEMLFFDDERTLKKKYLKPINKKEL